MVLWVYYTAFTKRIHKIDPTISKKFNPNLTLCIYLVIEILLCTGNSSSTWQYTSAPLDLPCDKTLKDRKERLKHKGRPMIKAFPWLFNWRTPMLLHCYSCKMDVHSRSSFSRYQSVESFLLSIEALNHSSLEHIHLSTRKTQLTLKIHINQTHAIMQISIQCKSLIFQEHWKCSYLW